MKAPQSASSGSPVIINIGIPDPTRSAGAHRLIRIAVHLAQIGHPPHVVGFLDQKSTEVTPGTSVEHAPRAHPLEDGELARILNESSVVWVRFPELAARIILLLDRAGLDVPVIYDTIDLHYVRIRRQADQTGAPLLRAVSIAFFVLEVLTARNARATIAISDVESARLRRWRASRTIRTVPTLHEVPESVPGRSGRDGLVFVGGFAHGPNVDAALRLVRDVMPRIWASDPRIRLRVIGSNPPQQLLESPDERVEVLGWVSDLDAILDGAVALLAPLSFGAGVKGKITGSLARGLPVVTTSVGAEGLPDEVAAGCLVTNDDDALAECALRLHRDTSLWQQLSERGRTGISQWATGDAVTGTLEELLEIAR